MRDSENKAIEQMRTTEMALAEIAGMPEDAFAMLHKYGTYNIQPTAESGNEFPEIAQGITPQKTHREINPHLNEPMGYMRRRKSKK